MLPNKIMMYLEEYARKLCDEMDALAEQNSSDRDFIAGEEARELYAKVRDIRHVISLLSRTELVEVKRGRKL